MFSFLTKLGGRKGIGNRSRKARIPSQRGYRDDLNAICDSKMEANVYRFYKYLERKHGKIKVEYEPKGFKFRDNRYGIHRYIPDFKIVSGKDHWYIEVKGFMDAASNQKHTLLSEQYKGVKLRIITPKEYKKIAKAYGDIIPNWE